MRALNTHLGFVTRAESIRLSAPLPLSRMRPAGS
jgi:hypothetical protein